MLQICEEDSKIKNYFKETIYRYFPRSTTISKQFSASNLSELTQIKNKNSCNKILFTLLYNTKDLTTVEIYSTLVCVCVCVCVCVLCACLFVCLCACMLSYLNFVTTVSDMVAVFTV